MNKVSELNEQLNDKLIHFLKEELGRHKVNKVALCREMGISTSILYKRLSGQSQFTIGEVAFLMQKYGLSFDRWVWKNQGYSLFTNPAHNNHVHSLESYLMTLQHLFKSLDHIKDPLIHYAARELPLFYYFSQPKLGAFKLFIFGKVVWNIPAYAGSAPFSYDLFSPFVLNSLSELWDKYASLNSVEIWNPNVLDNTLQQIIYLLELRQFQNPEDALLLIKMFEDMISHLKQMIQGCKKINSKGAHKGSLALYNNRIMHTNNMIIAGGEDKQMLFITHSNPNFLTSDDSSVINHTLTWMKQLIQYASHVSVSEDKVSEPLLSTLEQKVQFAASKIEALLARDKVML